MQHITVNLKLSAKLLILYLDGNFLSFSVILYIILSVPLIITIFGLENFAGTGKLVLNTALESTDVE